MLQKMFGNLRAYFRQRRYLQVKKITKVESRSGFILDLGGGSASFFAALFPEPARVILIDVDYSQTRQAKQKHPDLYTIVADGRHLPLIDRSIGMSICNSVVEHVDSSDLLAEEIRRVSQRYFVQIPNGDFPLEVHSFIPIPFYNLIPWQWARRLVCRLFGADFDYVSSVHYIPEQRLRDLFPEATIAYEKAFGLIKSFYVYHLGDDIS